MLQINDNYYATNFNQNVILLDIKRDKYLILGTVMSKNLRAAIEDNLIISKKFTTLLNKKYIIKNTGSVSNNNYHFYNIPKKGAANLDWRMRYGNLHAVINKVLLIKTLRTLVFIYILLKFKKMQGLISYMKKLKYKNSVLSENFSSQQIDEMIIALDQACFVFPFKVKCLLWSVTLFVMLIKANQNCVFKIGVQNYPFLAHAWVEFKKEVVSDEQSLSEDLSIIFQV